MMIKFKKPRGISKGFTLVEFQVASVIGFFTILAIVSLYIFLWRSSIVGNTLLDVYANSRNASGWLMRDIRCAALIEPNHTAGGSSYTTSDSSIVLKVPSLDASGNPMTSAYDYIIYELSGSDLYRIVFKNAASSRLNENRVVANYCTSLTFRSGSNALSYYVSNGTLSTLNSIGICLPLNKMAVSLSGAGTSTETITPTTVVRLRNK